MKKYYASVTSYASDDHKRELADGINPSQRGNESQIAGELSQYSVTVKKMNRLADLIGAGFAPIAE